MRRALVAVVAIVAASASLAQVSRADPASASVPPHVAAAAWYVVGEDGSVVAEHRARERRAMASITKLMTAIVTLEHVRLSDVVTVSPRAARVGESTVYLRAGQQLTVSELLRGMLVRSANDAAEALALYVGRGSESRFVAMMNARARQLGLTDTTFKNPHGLDAPGHVSSARDVTYLVRYALGIPFIRDALSRDTVSVPEDGVFPTTDDLLDDWGPLVGGKTGHTDKAGWSETAEASERGVKVFGAVLGSPSRAARNGALETLLAYGLGQYGQIEAVDPTRTYAVVRTGYGRPSIDLVAPGAKAITVRRGEGLVERVVAPTSVALPVHRGQRLGRVEVLDGDRVVASSGLVAATSVEKPSVIGKMWWYARRTAHNLWGLVT